MEAIVAFWLVLLTGLTLFVGFVLLLLFVPLALLMVGIILCVSGSWLAGIGCVTFAVLRMRR